MLGQFIRFAGVGFIGTIIHYAVLIALVELGDIEAALATTCGFVLGAISNYVLNRLYTFKSTVALLPSMLKFMSISTVGAGLNGAIVHTLTASLGWNYLLAQVFATGLVLVWNFFGNRLWTFNDATARE